MKIEELSKRIDQGLKKAVADAVKRHKLLGQPIAIWKDGKTVVIPPEEITLPENKINKKKTKGSRVQ